jgi:hypothetical protein
LFRNTGDEFLLYLLDANTLIDADQYYYGVNQVPQFWEWLLREAEADRVKMPEEIWHELKASNSDLGPWINNRMHKELLILDEQPNADLLNAVINTAYAPDLTDAELEQIGADPFLVAYGLVDPAQRVVVTKEVSAISKVRGRRKLPDACNIMGVSWMTDFGMYKALNFRTV